MTRLFHPAGFTRKAKGGKVCGRKSLCSLILKSCPVSCPLPLTHLMMREEKITGHQSALELHRQAHTYTIQTYTQRQVVMRNIRDTHTLRHDITHTSHTQKQLLHTQGHTSKPNEIYTVCMHIYNNTNNPRAQTPMHLYMYIYTQAHKEYTTDHMLCEPFLPPMLKFCSVFFHKLTLELFCSEKLSFCVKPYHGVFSQHMSMTYINCMPYVYSLNNLIKMYVFMTCSSSMSCTHHYQWPFDHNTSCPELTLKCMTTS